MPIAELSGIQFDMQLLLKLSVSVAAVLLISWAYRFYSSRNERNKLPCGNDNKEIQNTGCEECKKTQQCQSLQVQDKDDEDKKHSTSEDPTTESSKEIIPNILHHQAEKTEDGLSNGDQDKCRQEEILHYQDQSMGSTSTVSPGSAFSLHDPTGNKKASSTGRRSPCFLTKLEGSLDVGRELRQNLKHQGIYSSFLSKAEIKVKNVKKKKVLQEGSEDRIVHGKIYDYYVESSSHSVADSKTFLGQYEKNTEPKQEFGFHDSSFTKSPPSVSPIIMHDFVIPESTVEDISLQGSLMPKHPARPALLCKGSHLSPAAESELSIPFQISTTLTPTTHSLASTCDKTISLQNTTISTEHKVQEEIDLETIVGAPFSELPAEIFLDPDLQILKSKLDLDNSLEILNFAKKNSQLSVQEAALGVMSDNYLQVFRDPNLYGRLMADEREHIRKQRKRGRRFVIAADMDPHYWLKNTKGQGAKAEQKNISRAIYYYDDNKDSWNTLCLIPQEVISKACAMCTMDNYLFVAVGCQGRDREMTPSKRVFCYNPLTSIWKEISPMNEARPRCKLAALEGYIYAIGGECLSSVERYDPRLDRWTFVAPLPNDTFAVAHHVTVCSGELFVSGGTLRYLLLRYNPKTNYWSASLIVGSNNRTTDMVAVGRFLYRFDINPLLGVSVYRYHTVARLWYQCSSKRLLHCPAFQCVAVDSTIYCIGRNFTMRFEADEISPSFVDQDFSIISAAKGILFPFVLHLPDKNPRQTSV